MATQQHRIKKDDNYYESHHIIPKSLGGNNLSENIVLLTPKEHFITHLLLTKMTKTKKDTYKMCKALALMSALNIKSAKGYTSRLYTYHRKHISRTISEQYTGSGNPFYGKKHTDELKRWFSENNPTKREDVKIKMRKPKDCSNRHVPCSESKKKILSEKLKGHKQSEETKQKKRLAKANLIWIHQIPNKPKQIKKDERENFSDWLNGRGPQKYW